MKQLFMSFSEEELQTLIITAMYKVLENFSPKTEEIRYLTRGEVAGRLHISLPTLNDYTKTGKLKGYRINGRVLYREDEVNSALTAVEPLKYRRS
jgi:excisionase family DNA binding protein